MYFAELLSQYMRFMRGNLSAPDWVYWLNSHSDEMEAALSDDEWDVFVAAQHAAAEYSSGYIDEDRFQEVLAGVMQVDAAPIAPYTYKVVVNYIASMNHLLRASGAMYDFLVYSGGKPYGLEFKWHSALPGRELPKSPSVHTTANTITRELELVPA